MSYSNLKYELTDDFKKEYKKLQKKYMSLNKDFENLVSEIKQNPKLGTNLGDNLYKIRMKISAKNRGKSGGARVITKDVIIDVNREVLFVAIYDKSDTSNIPVDELKAIVEKYEDGNNCENK